MQVRDGSVEWSFVSEDPPKAYDPRRDIAKHPGTYLKNGKRYDYKGCLVRVSNEHWDNHELLRALLDSVDPIIEFIAERVRLSPLRVGASIDRVHTVQTLSP